MTTASIPRPVQLGLTVFLTALCSGLFLAVYVQLWLLLRYKQGKLSYQSALLFLGLLWAACRTVFFCFYLTDSAWAGELGTFPHWLLYCAPLCLQFISLCLLSLYFSQVLYKARTSTDFTSRIPQYICFVSLTLVFLVVNLSCILIGGRADDEHGWLTLARIIVSDCLFATCSIVLANNTYRIATTAPVYVYLESKGSSGRTTVVTGSLICILYISRALYNLVMVSLQSHSKPTPFSYGWNGVSDRIVTEEVNGMEYFIFGIIIVLCEFIPMSIIAHYFRAKKPAQSLAAAGMVNSHSFGSRAYFFDNPRRYDSDDDLTRLATTRGERGSFSSTPKTSGCYGAVGSTSGCALAPPLLEPSTGTPVLFTCGGTSTS